MIILGWLLISLKWRKCKSGQKFLDCPLSGKIMVAPADVN
jgi:hypothetical protein